MSENEYEINDDELIKMIKVSLLILLIFMLVKKEEEKHEDEIVLNYKRKKLFND